MDYKKMYEESCILIEAQKQYRKDSELALKNEIAKSLHVEFEDFFETTEMPMSEMLGEIYKQKLLKIAGILAKYDINVN